MADFLSYAGLQHYDEKLKAWVRTNMVEQTTAFIGTEFAASATIEGKIAQYVGASDTTYTQGYFYICQEVTDTPGTYEWKQIDVQPATTLTDIIDDNAGATVTDKTFSVKKIHDVIEAEAKDGIYKAETSTGAGDEVTIAKAIKALEDATSLNYKGTATAAISTPADGDLYYFNIPAVEGVSAAVKGWQFYSATDTAWKVLSDDAVEARVAALETQVGKDKTVTPYESKNDLVDIINVLTAGDTVSGSVAKVVKDAVKDLEGAMHFKAVVTPDRSASETDEQAMDAWYAAQSETPAPGDVFVVSDNGKEYIVSAYDESTTTATYREIGDEGLYVQKTTTIAGVDLQDNITADELKTALDIDDLETAVGKDDAGDLIPVVDTVKANAKDGIYAEGDVKYLKAVATVWSGDIRCDYILTPAQANMLENNIAGSNFTVAAYPEIIENDATFSYDTTSGVWMIYNNDIHTSAGQPVPAVGGPTPIGIANMNSYTGTLETKKVEMTIAEAIASKIDSADVAAVADARIANYGALKKTLATSAEIDAFIADPSTADDKTIYILKDGDFYKQYQKINDTTFACVGGDVDLSDIETAIGKDTDGNLVSVATRIADEAKDATYKAADPTEGTPKVTIAEAIKALEDHAADTNGALVYKGTQTAVPTTGELGDAYLIEDKLYVCSKASADGVDAEYTELAIDSTYFTTAVGTGYEIEQPDKTKKEVDVKKYIDSRIFVGTQAEYDTKLAAGEIDSTTFAVIVDQSGESLVPITEAQIDSLFA